MINYSFSIEVKYNTDFKKIKELLTSHEIKYELVKTADRKSTIFEFESNYGEDDLISEIGDALNFYEVKKDLSTGKFEIGVHIQRYKSPLSSDSWGRLLNSEGIDEHFYLVIEEKEELRDFRLKQINSKSIAGVTKIMDSKTKKIGFAIYIFPQPTIFQASLQSGQRLQFLNEGLYQTEEEAFQSLKETLEKMKKDSETNPDSQK